MKTSKAHGDYYRAKRAVNTVAGQIACVPAVALGIFTLLPLEIQYSTRIALLVLILTLCILALTFYAAQLFVDRASEALHDVSQSDLDRVIRHAVIDEQRLFIGWLATPVRVAAEKLRSQHS